jgi:hypothetical protein
MGGHEWFAANQQLFRLPVIQFYQPERSGKYKGQGKGKEHFPILGKRKDSFGPIPDVIGRFIN